MGTKSSHRVCTTFKKNTNKAVKTLTAKWAELNPDEQKSWQERSLYNVSKNLDKTGYYAFMHHYMGIFASTENTNDMDITEITLSDGDSKLYRDRASRTFTSTKVPKRL